MIRTAIHLHTDYSPDSNQSPEALLDAAEREGIDCVAITDHDEIEGALRARDAGRARVIVGEEISTRDGHLIGLFLETRIAPGLSVEATIQQIRDQGGLVLAPHPFSRLCDGSLGDALARVVDQVDAVEVHNAQNPIPRHDHEAERFAREHGVPAYVGCDTHIRGRLAPAFQMLPAFGGPRDFIAALRGAEQVRGRFGLKYLAAMGFRHGWDAVVGLSLPGFGVNARGRSTAAAESTLSA